MKRCEWAQRTTLERDYHDTEWGKPLHDDEKLFEMLTLESMQAGLSWSTIIKKRAAMRIAFDQFDYRKIAMYDEEKMTELLNNPEIIRHRGKIAAMINNAQQYMHIQQEYGSFDMYIWSFVNHQPQMNHWETMEEIPATTETSIEISKSLKKAGFKFVGPTSIYALMQSIGMVNDHLESCDYK
jgi:3-methyladenine DNA glycosylase